MGRRGIRTFERPVHSRAVEALLHNALASAFDDAGAYEPAFQDVLVILHSVVVALEVLEFLFTSAEFFAQPAFVSASFTTAATRPSSNRRHILICFIAK